MRQSTAPVPCCFLWFGAQLQGGPPGHPWSRMRGHETIFPGDRLTMPDRIEFRCVGWERKSFRLAGTLRDPAVFQPAPSGVRDTPKTGFVFKHYSEWSFSRPFFLDASNKVREFFSTFLELRVSCIRSKLPPSMTVEKVIRGSQCSGAAQACYRGLFCLTHHQDSSSRRLLKEMCEKHLFLLIPHVLTPSSPWTRFSTGESPTPYKLHSQMRCPPF